MAIKLIIGLGNPGSQYEKTRHNVGAWFVDYLAQDTGAKLRVESKFFSSIAKASVDQVPCWLAKPTTFMNESGRPVVAISNFYKLPPESILVVHDELDFEPGIVRLKKGGGHGGHNGLRDIIKCLGSSDFYRLRIGIGHPGHKDRVSPYVLSAPNRADHASIVLSLDEAFRSMSDLVRGEFDRAFHALHSD